MLNESKKLREERASIVSDAGEIIKKAKEENRDLTVEEQEKLVASGRSQTMKSKHLIQDDGFSHAVDVVAYDGSDVVWEINVYDNICDAFKKAAQLHGVSIKWGAAWSEGDIRSYPGTAEDAMMKYVDLRRSEGRRPFIDGPHFELIG